MNPPRQQSELFYPILFTVMALAIFDSSSLQWSWMAAKKGPMKFFLFLSIGGSALFAVLSWMFWHERRYFNKAVSNGLNMFTMFCVSVGAITGMMFQAHMFSSINLVSVLNVLGIPFIIALWHIYLRSEQQEKIKANQMMLYQRQQMALAQQQQQMALAQQQQAAQQHQQAAQQHQQAAPQPQQDGPQPQQDGPQPQPVAQAGSPQSSQPVSPPEQEPIDADPFAFPEDHEKSS